MEVIGQQDKLYLITTSPDEAVVLDTSSDPPKVLPSRPVAVYSGAWDAFTQDPTAVLKELERAVSLDAKILTEDQYTATKGGFKHGDVWHMTEDGKEIRAP